MNNPNRSGRVVISIPIVLLFLSACALQDEAPATGSSTVSIMTFNVENLFDNADDPGKDDRTY
ncbi:MAG: hypothetical protein WBN34_14705, partial [Woeseia sp.]